jgi:hypothetical protein
MQQQTMTSWNGFGLVVMRSATTATTPHLPAFDHQSQRPRVQSWKLLEPRSAIAQYGFESVRLEGFAAPAWSIGRVVSPAVHKEESYSVALAFLLGS